VLIVGRSALRIVLIAYHPAQEVEMSGRDRGGRNSCLDLVGIIVDLVDRTQGTVDMCCIHVGEWYPKIGSGWKNTG